MIEMIGTKDKNRLGQKMWVAKGVFAPLLLHWKAGKACGSVKNGVSGSLCDKMRNCQTGRNNGRSEQRLIPWSRSQNTAKLQID